MEPATASAGRRRAVEPGRTARPVRGRVRPLRREDIGTVAELHRAAFDHRGSADDVADFLGNVFFGHPWCDESLPSLAYEDRRGRVVGCLGIMPRPMTFRGEPLRAIVTHNLMVAPDAHGLAAIELLRAVTRLPVDACFSEANVAGRGVAEAVGAQVVASRSLRWFRPLRACALAAHLLSRRLPARVAASAERAASAADALIARIPRGRQPGPGRGHTAPLDATLLAELVDRFAARFALRPVYTAEALAWLLASLRASRRDQNLRARVVRDGGERVGWFIYYSRPSRIGRVLQVGAAPSAGRLVLAHLLEDAKRDGNVGITGAFDPVWADDIGASGCLLGTSESWLMTYAQPEIRDALHAGDAFFGRLEGEGWLRFAF